MMPVTEADKYLKQVGVLPSMRGLYIFETGILRGKTGSS